MSSARTVIGSAIVVFVVALAIFAWRDRVAPVTITIEPLPAESLRVSVVGAVATPGVVTVPAGARLADVAQAAGGLTADADVAGLNLAGRVGDGEHIVIPREVAADPAPPGDTSAAPAEADGALDLNRASAADLEQLPGIGPVLAQRIVDYREAHGPFANVNELTGVQGISVRLLEQLRPHITVDDGG